MKCKVAGIKFAVDGNPAIAFARPEGSVELKLDPVEWKDRKGNTCRDDDAVGIYYEDIRVGFMPATGDERKTVLEIFRSSGEMPPANVVEYCYSTGGNNFNTNHEGILASLLIDIVVESQEGNDFSHYKKDGKKYTRASDAMDGVSMPGKENLLRWMIDTFATFKEYQLYMQSAADNGTERHDGMRIACENGIIGCGNQQVESIVRRIPEDDFKKIPPGFWNFIANETEGLLADGVEKTVFNDEYMIAGTYDLRVMRIIDNARITIDWKSSKKFYIEHVIKTCWYAVENGSTEAWIVIFGVNTAKGYRVLKITDPAKLLVAHKILCLGKAVQDLFAVLGDKILTNG